MTKSRHQRSLSHLRATHEATNRERLLEAKSLIKTALHQRLDDLRSDFEHRLESSKAKLDAKYANQDPGLPNEAGATYAREVEAYRRAKEAQLKRDRDLIEEEYLERRVQEDKAITHAYTLESVQKVIRGIREQNEGLKRVVGQRMEELKEVRPAGFVPRAER